MPWSGKWQHTSVFLPEKFHEQKSLVGYSSWGRKESDMIELVRMHNVALTIFLYSNFSSVQFSCSVMSNSLQPHGLQHARPPCPSPTPGVHSNSCPLSWWFHPTISSSVAPFPSCSQSFPTSGSFPMSWIFASGGRSMGASLQHQFFQWIFSVDFL